jgi:hypothetical protein
MRELWETEEPAPEGDEGDNGGEEGGEETPADS